MKLRPQFNLRFRSAEQFVQFRDIAAARGLAVNEWLLRQAEASEDVALGLAAIAGLNRKVGNNAEIATGGSAGVAAAGISPEGKRGVQKGAAGDHGELLRGQSVSGAAAAKGGRWRK
jgi:hypothetical protein